MIKTIRQILLTEYIGSILVALLGCQAIIVVATSILRDLLWYWYRSRAGILADTRPPFPWDNFVFSATSVVLYLLIAYLLARWLYLVPPSQLTETEPPLDESEQP
jgi:hypothetical protein